MTTDRALANPVAYDIWAASYPPVPHNPLMRAEQRAMQELWPATSQLKGSSVLDLACGTGRYAKLLEQSGAQVVSMDFSVEMLRRLEATTKVRGDMMALPFVAGAFEIVISGLAVGHAPRLESWTAQIARVLKPGGLLLYSDFHPSAADAGMTRSFTDAEKREHTLLHRRYTLADHQRAAREAGLEVDATREVRVGIELKEGFAGAETFYRRWHGLPVVLAIRARKPLGS